MLGLAAPNVLERVSPYRLMEGPPRCGALMCSVQRRAGAGKPSGFRVALAWRPGRGSARLGAARRVLSRRDIHSMNLSAHT